MSKTVYWMNGYLATTVNGKPKYQHVILAERAIGRRLLNGECVHHKDENRSNNAPSNLIVFASRADHTRFHSIGLDESFLVPVGNGAYRCDPSQADKLDKGKLLSCSCRHCGIQMITQRQRYSNAFCSKKCFGASKRVAIRPLVDELVEQIQSKGFEGTGRAYGVSGNAVRKWLKQEGFDPKTLQPV